MPHAELHYSCDLDVDLPRMFEAIEQTIQRHDPGAGACKCRAYPATHYRHSHCLLTLSMLVKPHRDADFSAALMADLDRAVTGLLAQPCYFSLDLSYTGSTYLTRQHAPDA